MEKKSQLYLHREPTAIIEAIEEYRTNNTISFKVLSPPEFANTWKSVSGCFIKPLPNECGPARMISGKDWKYLNQEYKHVYSAWEQMMRENYEKENGISK